MDIRKKMAVGIVTTALLLGSLAIALLLGRVAGSAFAANNGTDHFGPFASTSPDTGSCGNVWATDTADRYFTVRNTGSNTYSVREDFKNGTFVTNAGASPGACETSNNHGTIVKQGVTGDLQGWFNLTVTGATTYNPGACSTNPSPCITTSGFVTSVFPGASFTYDTYNFEYSSSDQSLVYHHWQDMLNGSKTSDQLIGDIANQ